MGLEPKNVEALRVRGRACFDKGEPEKALTDLDQAISPIRTTLRRWRPAARSTTSRKNGTRRSPTSRRRSRCDPKNVEALRGRGRAYLEKEKLGEALTDLGKAIAIDKDDTEALLSRAMVYHERKELDKAIDDYTVVLRHEPQNVDALRGRGRAYFEKNKPERGPGRPGQGHRHR